MATNGGNIHLKNNPAVFVSFEAFVAFNKGQGIKNTNMEKPQALKLRK
jgi:hypothetical protein